MIINSPIGRFPYEIGAVTLDQGQIRIDGAMGTWPTSVEVAPAELPGLAWRLLGARRAAVVGSAAAVALLVGARIRR
ncbi:MAG TPA: hypothetical protein VH268_02765 [Solirubrobacterales bacterium]|jgi:hypothetical protein|nr:hypothetical protein [Solirubrobacterales bacterium]